MTRGLIYAIINIVILEVPVYVLNSVKSQGVRAVKQIFIKITGVTPKELATLHSLYKDGLCQKAKNKVFWLKLHTADSNPVLVEILSAKLDIEHSTYTVELRVDAVRGDICPPSRNYQAFRQEAQSAGEWELYAPASVLAHVWKALGIFPCEEQFIKVRD